MKYTIGVDFGTLSARAVVLCLSTGKIISSYTSEYKNGVIDSTLEGRPLPPDYALQNPNDYLCSIKESITGALKAASISNAEVGALCIDFTSCSILPHLADGTPLCNVDGFSSNPHAYVKLWKHHGAKTEAADLERVAKENNLPWLKYYNNTVSSENFFSKTLETYKNSPELFEKTYHFSEAGDWLSFMLTGKETCSAAFVGFKSYWNEQDGFPTEEYLDSVETDFGEKVYEKMCHDVIGAGKSVGTISKSGAELCGLCEGTVVATPMIDAHVPLISLGINADNALMMVLGTSGCYIVNNRDRKEIYGICGSSSNAVVPDYCTYEAALSCFGDQLDWYIKTLLKDTYSNSAAAHNDLTQKASQLKIGESGLVALNWFNGNRCPLSDFNLSGAILGLTLTTRPEEIYRALVEGAVFATAILIENYKNAGISIENIVATGGISRKNEFLMSMLSDVIGLPISVTSSTEGAAHGCAIMAAVVGGEFDSLDSACKKLSAPVLKTYYPDSDNHNQYQKLFDVYKRLHNLLGIQNRDIMHTLKEIQKNATKNKE